MKAQTEKTNKKQLPIQRAEQQASTGGTATIEDNRPRSVYQRKLQRMMNSSNDDENNPIQRKPNNTGLPGNLKTGIENLSGYSMDDVKVHYNSSKPAQLQAHAYAQGTNIHLAPGQEKHLPHEAWHVVQQKQGRVRPTMQFKGKVDINDDAGLEREADVMGARALTSVNNQSKVEKEGRLIREEVAQLQGLKKSKGAKVGMEIETTLPVFKKDKKKPVNLWKLYNIVRGHTKYLFPKELLPHTQELLNDKQANYLLHLLELKNQSKQLNKEQTEWWEHCYMFIEGKLREKLDPGYGNPIKKGKCWFATVDHSLTNKSLFDKEELMMDSVVEIVTDPVDNVKDSKEIMGSVLKWLSSIKETVSAKKIHLDGDHMYMMPGNTSNTLLENGMLKGNIQVNVGVNLEDTVDFFKYALLDNRDVDQKTEIYILNQGFVNKIIKKLNEQDPKYKLEENDPFFHGIIFQFLYHGFRLRDKGSGDTVKNRYPILPKTKIATQIRLSSWKNKYLWDDAGFRELLSKELKSFISEDKKLKALLNSEERQEIERAIIGNQEVNERIPAMHYIDNPEKLVTRNGEHPGVFEIRFFQNISCTEDRWLQIWDDFIVES